LQAFPGSYGQFQVCYITGAIENNKRQISQSRKGTKRQPILSGGRGGATSVALRLPAKEPLKENWSSHWRASVHTDGQRIATPIVHHPG
jgi:hypothetical protein